METPAVVETPAVAPPTVENKLDRIQLPKPENKTQARRLAKFLFGPLVRLDEVEHDVWAVATERNGIRNRIAFGPDMHTALRRALLAVIEAAEKGKVFQDVIQIKPPTNSVEEKRRALVVALADEDTDTLDALHPHEVLEVSALVRIRQFDPIKPITAVAKSRANDRKAATARAQKEEKPVEEAA